MMSVMADDDDDWVGEPPEGRYTRDRAKPDFWRSQWQAIVATSLLGVVIVIAIVIVLVAS
jgi:hypothetical protein